MWRVWFFVQGDDPHAALDTFIAITRKAFIATLLPAGVTLIFSCLGAFASYGPQCSGYELIEQYRPRDFAGLLLWSGFTAFMLWRVAWPTPRLREQFEKSFAKDFQFTHGSGWFEMTHGMRTAYIVIFSLCAMSALPVWIAITHYLTVLNYCQLVTAPH